MYETNEEELIEQTDNSVREEDGPQPAQHETPDLIPEEDEDASD